MHFCRKKFSTGAASHQKRTNRQPKTKQTIFIKTVKVTVIRKFGKTLTKWLNSVKIIKVEKKASRRALNNNTLQSQFLKTGLLPGSGGVF